MDDIELAEKVFDQLKFCPECGKELEIDPIAMRLACFLHGEFVLGKTTIIWNYTKNLIKR